MKKLKLIHLSDTHRMTINFFLSVLIVGLLLILIQDLVVKAETEQPPQPECTITLILPNELFEQ